MKRLSFVATSVIVLAMLGTEAVIAQQGRSVSSDDSRAVLAGERGIWESIKRGDWQSFDRALEGMTYVNPGGIVVWKSGMSENLKGLSLASYTWDDVQTRLLAPRLVLLTYKATADQTFNGKKTPSPVYMMSLWQKQGNKWMTIAHSETPAAAP